MSETALEPQPLKKSRLKTWVFDLLLLCVLLMGAYLRFIGINWGEYQYLHPDERFLVWVGSDITPLKCLDANLTIDACPADQKTWMSFGEYFDAAKSTLNPVNRGHGFYVYGTLPMFLARFAVEWIYGHSGFNEMTDVGRPLSALADLLTVLLVYAIAARQYNRRVGILAAAFTAMMVLMIQQSHFFTMDTFVSMFTYLAIYFAVRVSLVRWQATRVEEAGEPSVEGEAPPPAPVRRGVGQFLRDFARNPLFWMSIAFGFALGCAVASKLNSAPVAVMLPAGMALTFVPLKPAERKRFLLQAFGYLVLGAVVSVVVFRLFQPYAFSGPGLLGLKPNPQWVANIREQRIQAAGDVDYPPSMQWARRPLWFSGENLVLWGLGLPLGILAWAGFLWAGWRMLKGDWQRHVLLWGWVGFYFIWQSLAFNPTMRYQLPIYPALGIFAAWALVALYDLGKDRQNQGRSGGKWLKAAAFLIGVLALAGTFAWAFAFTRIYARPITRVAAARSDLPERTRTDQFAHPGRCRTGEPAAALSLWLCPHPRAALRHHVHCPGDGRGPGNLPGARF